MQSPLPLSRAKRRLRFIGKASEHLGWKMSALSKTYALAGAIEVPSWGPTGEGEVRSTRDNDLRTAWACSSSKGAGCALGIHFPKPATVVAIRLNASPDGAEDPAAFGHVRTVRVHTDDGWAEDDFPENIDDGYLRLGEPVQTASLTVEVTDTYEKGPVRIRFAEFDALGTEGEMRSPIVIDPAAATLRLANTTYTKIPDGFAITAPRLEYPGPKGVPRVLTHATAMLGAGDSLMLIEHLAQTKCKSHVGSYTMLDLKTHVRVPLGDLGGIPGMFFRHKAGEGFAVGYVSEDITRVHAAVREQGGYQRKKSSRASRDTYHELFAEWNMDETPIPRGGGTIDNPPDKCTAASPTEFATMVAARSKGSNRGGNKGRRASVFGGPPDRWLSCRLTGGATAFASTGGASCGTHVEVVLVGASGEFVDRRTVSRKGARMRVQRVNDDRILIEVGGAGNEVELLDVRASAIESMGMGTALSLSPPASCRDRCDTPFVNPRAR